MIKLEAETLFFHPKRCKKFARLWSLNFWYESFWCWNFIFLINDIIDRVRGRKTDLKQENFHKLRRSQNAHVKSFNILVAFLWRKRKLSLCMHWKSSFEQTFKTFVKFKRNHESWDSILCFLKSKFIFFCHFKC